MQTIDEVIAQLKERLAVNEEYNKKLYNSGMFCTKHYLENQKEYLCLLEKVKEVNIDLSKEYKISKLTFGFDFRESYLEFYVNYEQALASEIYDSFSGSWSTQYCDLQKWLKEQIYKEGFLPLNNESFQKIQMKYIDNLVDKIKKTIQILENPNERLVWMVNHYLEFIYKKIEWYKKDEENYFLY